MRKIATTFCTQCNAMLEPGSKQCGQAYSAGEPMQMRSWDTQDADNEWLVVRTQMPVKCFEAARNERGNVRWPKDPDAVVSVIEIDIPAPVRAAPAPLPQALEESIEENPDLFGGDVIEELEERKADIDARLEALRATDEEEFAGIYPTWFLAEERDGESIADRIARMTRKFRARVNELTNKLLAGEITPEEEAERDSLMDQYNMLAELGDRS